MNAIKICFAVGIAACFLASCDHSQDSHATEEKNHPAEEQEKAIVIHAGQEKAMGIKTQQVSPGLFRQVLKTGGEVLPTQASQAVVVAKSNGTVRLASNITTGVFVKQNSTVCTISSAGIEGGDPKVQAQIVYETAQKEYERIKGLYDSRLATAKELRDAQQALDIAKNALNDNAKSTIATSPISGVVSQLFVQNGSFVTTGTPIAVVCENSRLVLRAVVPQESYDSYPLFQTANFKLPYSDTVFSLKDMNGKRISTTTLSPVSSGYFTVEFEFANGGSVVPGSYAEVYLLGTDRENVISLPLSAIVEEEGTHSVFVKSAAEHYEKRPVVLGDTDGLRIEVKSGLKKGESVVTEGALYVKMAANSGTIPEGHNHQH